MSGGSSLYRSLLDANKSTLMISVGLHPYISHYHADTAVLWSETPTGSSFVSAIATQPNVNEFLETIKGNSVAHARINPNER